MRRLPPLHALLAFETTARHLSVRRAAEKLNLLPSAVSYQLRTIESYLGVRQFLSARDCHAAAFSVT
jgi:LysR family transcriptional regulator, glycine cleavage system transcriptional activator